MSIGDAATSRPAAHEDRPPVNADSDPRRFLHGGSGNRSGRAEPEIAREARSLSKRAPGEGVTAGRPHPLGHSWTFWFDSPAAKSSQAAWGSSIRPIYTFATVEEFWRYSDLSVFLFGFVGLVFGWSSSMFCFNLEKFRARSERERFLVEDIIRVWIRRLEVLFANFDS